MAKLSNEEFESLRTRARSYCALLLKAGPNYQMPGARDIIYEHGRRNMELLLEGRLPIVCPVVDGGELKGLGLFNAEEDEVRRIMDEDPGVKAGIFVYETHPVRGFPGSALPEKDT